MSVRPEIPNIDQAALDNAFREQLWNFRESGSYCDMVIRCGQEKFNAHRLIICSQSKVFKAMVDGGFKESQMTPEGVVEINLVDEEPVVVQCLISYLYTGSCILRSDLEEQFSSEVGDHLSLFAAYLYVAAEKYDIPALSDLSYKLYNLSYSETPTESEGGLAKLLFFDILASSKVVYDMTNPNDRLRSAVAYHITYYANGISAKLKDCEEFREEFEHVIQESPDFAVDVFNILASSS